MTFVIIFIVNFYCVNYNKITNSYKRIIIIVNAKDPWWRHNCLQPGDNGKDYAGIQVKS